MSYKYISLHLICSAVILVATLGQAQAGVFKCVGDDGKVFYNDKPCPFEDRETEMEIVAKQNVMQSEVPVAIDVPLPFSEPVKKETVVNIVKEEPDLESESDAVLTGAPKPKRAASVDEDDAKLNEERLSLKEEMTSDGNRSEDVPLSPKDIEKKVYDSLYGRGEDTLPQDRDIPDAIGNSNQTDS